MSIFLPFKDCLKQKAFDSKKSRGRRNLFPDDDQIYFDVVDPFQIDINKILNSKARRRMKDKSQVYCFPENPHVRTRAFHTDEVATHAVYFSEILGLNTKLAEAIAQGHDIGHVPYGHNGEKFLSEVTGKNFRHEVMSVVVAQKIERKGLGINLNFETYEGIKNHSRGSNSLNINTSRPQEENLVTILDKIIYTFSDINDAERYGYARKKELPDGVYSLGENQRERIALCGYELVRESAESGFVLFSDSKVAKMFESVRQWMYKNVYYKVNWDIQKEVLVRCYNFFQSDPYFEGCEPEILIALMTDREMNRMAEVFLTGRKPKVEYITDFGIIEIMPYIKGRGIDITDPDLNWEK